MENYSCDLPPQDREKIVEQLKRQDVDFQREFYLFMEKTLAYGWDTTQRLETLDGRFQTYALEVVSGDRRLVMRTREVGTDHYIYLGLFFPGDVAAKEAAYDAACWAHQLQNPQRGP